MATVFQSETTYDSLLYTKSIIALLVPMLTTMQLFDDVLLFALMSATMMSLMADAMTANLM